MARYHIAESGKPALCTAKSEKSCPRGGEHYKTKDEAEFALQLKELQDYAAIQAHAVVAAQQLPDVRDDAAVEAYVSGRGSLDDLILDEEDDVDSQDCDHVGTGRTIKFDGGRMAKLCDRCNTIVGYASDDELVGLNAAAQRRAQNPLNDETQPEDEVGRLATLQRRKNAEALNGEDPGLAVGARATELRREKAPSPNQAFLDAYSPEVALRKLSDTELTSHLHAISAYNAAMENTDKPAIRQAVAELQQLGSPVAGYAWDPEGAERRLGDERDRRVAVVNIVNEDLVPRLVDAEDGLRKLAESSHPAADGANKKRLENKRAAVKHFRQQWAGKVIQAGSVDGINEVLANFDRNRKLTMTPEGAGGTNLHGPGWVEGLELARDYVAGYLK